MKRISGIIDLPVFCEKSGASAGVVNDILFDEKNLLTVGYVISNGSFLRILRFVNKNDISKIDEKGLWIKEKGLLKPLKKAGLGNVRSFVKDMAGADFVENGNKIGRISDMLFNTEAGEITHFQLSNGFAEDILHGRKIIFTNNENFFGNNKIGRAHV